MGDIEGVGSLADGGVAAPGRMTASGSDETDRPSVSGSGPCSWALGLSGTPGGSLQMAVGAIEGNRSPWLSPAGFGRRVVARGIDVLILGLLCYIPGTIGPSLPEYVIGYVGFVFRLGLRTSELWGLDRASLSELAGKGGFVLACLLYFTLCEARGQTLGKRMLGVRVVSATGERHVTCMQALVRSLSFVATSIPCGIGQLAILWDPQKRSWSDRLAGTRVVRVPWAGKVGSLARPVVATLAVTAFFSLGVPFAVLVAPLDVILDL